MKIILLALMMIPLVTILVLSLIGIIDLMISCLKDEKKFKPNSEWRKL